MRAAENAKVLAIAHILAASRHGRSLAREHSSKQHTYKVLYLIPSWLHSKLIRHGIRVYLVECVFSMWPTDAYTHTSHIHTILTYGRQAADRARSSCPSKLLTALNYVENIIITAYIYSNCGFADAEQMLPHHWQSSVRLMNAWLLTRVHSA